MKSKSLATYFIADGDAVAFPAGNYHGDKGRPYRSGEGGVVGTTLMAHSKKRMTSQHIAFV